MKEKIEQLCEQIKDLLRKNNREYLIAITPEETYSYPDFTFPEYFNSVSQFGFHKLLFDYSTDFDWENFELEREEEPIYEDDIEDHYDDEDFDADDYVMYHEVTQFFLIAIRIESDKLLFCVEKIFTDDEQSACENVEEVSISYLVDWYDEEIIVRALEAYVRLLSDETKSNPKEGRWLGF